MVKQVFFFILNRMVFFSLFHTLQMDPDCRTYLTQPITLSFHETEIKFGQVNGLMFLFHLIHVLKFLIQSRPQCSYKKGVYSH